MYTDIQLPDNLANILTAELSMRNSVVRLLKVAEELSELSAALTKQAIAITEQRDVAAAYNRVRREFYDCIITLHLLEKIITPHDGILVDENTRKDILFNALNKIRKSSI